MAFVLCANRVHDLGLIRGSIADLGRRLVGAALASSFGVEVAWIAPIGNIDEW